MVYVYHAVGITSCEIIRKHLHIARKHYEVNIIMLQKGKLLGFGLWLVLLCHRYHLKRYAELVADILQIGVIAHYNRYLNIPFLPLAGSVSCKKIIDAVRHLRHEYRHPLRVPVK